MIRPAGSNYVLEVQRVDSCLRGEIPIVKWNDSKKIYVIEIVKQVPVAHNRLK